MDCTAQRVAAVQINAPASQMHLVAADSEVDLLTDLVAVAGEVEVVALGARDRHLIALDSRHPAGEHVPAAHEFGHIGGTGLVVDLRSRRRLLDAASVHHHDHVCNRQRFRLGVGDMDEGDAEIDLDELQLGAHLEAQELIQR